MSDTLRFSLVSVAGRHLSRKQRRNKREYKRCHFSAHPESRQVLTQHQDWYHTDEAERHDERDYRENLADTDGIGKKTQWDHSHHGQDEHERDDIFRNVEKHRRENHGRPPVDLNILREKVIGCQERQKQYHLKSSETPTMVSCN